MSRAEPVLGAIPDAAMPAWRALTAALRLCGPAPCELADAEQWWPRSSSDPADEAVAVCWRCSVRRECGEYATAAREREGVWGGLTAAERSAA